jgi:hypothetical protein
MCTVSAFAIIPAAVAVVKYLGPLPGTCSVATIRPSQGSGWPEPAVAVSILRSGSKQT